MYLYIASKIVLYNFITGVRKYVDFARKLCYSNHSWESYSYKLILHAGIFKSDQPQILFFLFLPLPPISATRRDTAWPWL